jgi:hypothetical protein
LGASIISSADSPFTFSISESGTLGRPSGNRSYGFLAVYLIICSRVSLSTWASAPIVASPDATNKATAVLI